MQHDAAAPILLLSPHLDDAVLSAWTVLTAPMVVTVVNVFSGIPPSGFVTCWDRITGGRDSATHARERVHEDRQALALTNRHPINLGFLDSQYRGGGKNTDSGTRPTAVARDVSCYPSDGELEVMIGEAIEDFVNCTAAVYAPAGIGGHEDHLMVSRLARRIAAEAGCPLYFYAELPYAIRFGWPPWVTGDALHERLNPDADWEMHLELLAEQGEQIVPNVKRLSPASAKEKLASMETYRTQFTALNASVGGRLSDPDVMGWELVWTVGPVSAGCLGAGTFGGA